MRSDQPDIIEPTVFVGASVWHRPSLDSVEGKVTKIEGDMVTIDFYDSIIRYHRNDIVTKFIRDINSIILTCSPKAKGVIIRQFKSQFKS